MITNFKIFENSNGVYWKIPTTKEPYLSIALKKIGMPKSEIKNWVAMLKNHSTLYDSAGIFIFNDDGGWTYAGTGWKPPYIEINPTYMGEISMEELEIEANTQKYNL